MKVWPRSWRSRARDENAKCRQPKNRATGYKEKSSTLPPQSLQPSSRTAISSLHMNALSRGGRSVLDQGGQAGAGRDAFGFAVRFRVKVQMRSHAVCIYNCRTATVNEDRGASDSEMRCADEFHVVYEASNEMRQRRSERRRVAWETTKSVTNGMCERRRDHGASSSLHRPSAWRGRLCRPRSMDSLSCVELRVDEAI